MPGLAAPFIYRGSTYISSLSGKFKVAHLRGSKTQIRPGLLCLFYSTGILKSFCENSLVIQWLGLCPSSARGLGSIPGQGTKILQATRSLQKKERKKEKKKRLMWPWIILHRKRWPGWWMSPVVCWLVHNSKLSGERRQLWFVTFADFLGINPLTVADFAIRLKTEELLDSTISQ